MRGSQKLLMCLAMPFERLGARVGLEEGRDLVGHADHVTVLPCGHALSVRSSLAVEDDDAVVAERREEHAGLARDLERERRSAPRW